MVAVNRFAITCVTSKSSAVAGLATPSPMMVKLASVSVLAKKTSRTDGQAEKL